jgi:hypothetical protein
MPEQSRRRARRPPHPRRRAVDRRGNRVDRNRVTAVESRNNSDNVRFGFEPHDSAATRGVRAPGNEHLILQWRGLAPVGLEPPSPVAANRFSSPAGRNVRIERRRNAPCRQHGVFLSLPACASATTITEDAIGTSPVAPAGYSMATGTSARPPRPPSAIGISPPAAAPYPRPRSNRRATARARPPRLASACRRFPSLARP